MRHSRDFSLKAVPMKINFFVADTTMIWKLGSDNFIMSPSDDILVAFPMPARIV